MLSTLFFLCLSTSSVYHRRVMLSTLFFFFAFRRVQCTIGALCMSTLFRKIFEINFSFHIMQKKDCRWIPGGLQVDSRRIAGGFPVDPKGFPVDSRRIQKDSRRIQKDSRRIQKDSRWIPGGFPEDSRRIPGGFPEDPKGFPAAVKQIDIYITRKRYVIG